MNYSIISYIIGWILNFEALFMLLPCIVAVIYKESSGWAFVLAMLLCLLIGIPLTQRKPKNKIFYTKEGFLTVALSWIVLSIMGALPFILSYEPDESGKPGAFCEQTGTESAVYGQNPVRHLSGTDSA